MKVWLNGNLVEKEDAKISVFDHGALYGDGVFEGIRAYGGRIFQCQAHVDRLFQSAVAIDLPIPYSKQEMIDALYATLEANELSDAYIRQVATRGEGTLGLSPRRCSNPTMYIIADQVSMYTKEMYEQGMPVIIAKTVRCSPDMLDPRIKSLNYLNNIRAKIECLDAGMDEALMRNVHGDICEATGDNVFIVENGAVITPPPEAGILLGVTRGVVMHLARRVGLDVREETVSPERLMAAAECFLTGTAAEVISVTSVDHKSIGDGKVGPVTKKLFDLFHAFVRTDEEVPYIG